jgi:hypothetical protein
VTETSAKLAARIDPSGSPTTYHFDYGPTPEYGQSTAGSDLGEESGVQPAVAQLSGLEPDVTYHYRVVATNSWGVTKTSDSTFGFFPPSCPNEHVRQQTNASYLPDCRAFELVSPANAGSVTLMPGASIIGLPKAEFLYYRAPDASGLATSPSRFGFFGTFGSIIGLHPTNTLLDRYVATRTNGGWVTTYPGLSGDENLFVMNPECSVTMEECIDGPGPVGQNGVEVKHSVRYLWDVAGKRLETLPTNFAVVPGADEFIGDSKPSSDYSHYIFSSRNIAFVPGGLVTAPGSVYDNDISDGSVTLVSRTVSGAPIPQDGGGSSEFIRVLAVSKTGSHVLMSTIGPAGTQNLYLRVNDSITYELGAGNFVGMTEDGSKVAFTSPLQLSPADHDSSVDMYEWNEADGTITDLSQGNGNGDTDECTSTFAGACDVTPLVTERSDLDDQIAAKSGDVYFYSPEQLDPGNPGVKNERNLYVYHRGSVHYVTTLDPSTAVDRIQISADGDHMAFLSRTQATAYVNVSPDNGNRYDSQQLRAWEEMYTFDLETGKLLCASCIPTGAPPTIASAEVGRFISGTTKDVLASQSGPFMADDGRVAFTTADALVPSDTNGKMDVYEFTGNRPQLISSGTGNRDTQSASLIYPTVHAGLEAFSRDGTDLYFSTFETFVPEDLNGPFLKFYDARTNGGFPVPPTDLPCTAADECHGDSTSAPGFPSFATGADLAGSGMLPRHHRRRKAKGKKQKKRHRRVQHHGGRP